MGAAHRGRWGSGGITSVLVVMMLGQIRVFFAMSRDGLLGPWLSGVHPKFRTPHHATYLTGVAVAIMAALIPIGEAADMTNIGTLFAFVLVCIGIIVLRYTNPTTLGHSACHSCRSFPFWVCSPARDVFPPLDDLDPVLCGPSSAFWSMPRTGFAQQTRQASCRGMTHEPLALGPRSHELDDGNGELGRGFCRGDWADLRFRRSRAGA